MKKLDAKILLAGLVLVYILTVRLVLIPNWQETRKLRREEALSREKLASLTDLARHYQEIGPGIESVFGEGATSGFLSLVQQKTQELGLSGKFKAAVPVSRGVNPDVRFEGFDLRFEGVNLKDAVLFLETMEKESGFYLDRIILEKNRDGITLSARLRFLSVRSETRR